MNINLDAIRNGVSLSDTLGKLPKVPVASAVSGLIVAALILMTPNPWFEAFIVQTGLPDLISAAEPPLGARARIVFALIAALIVTITAWIVLSIIMGRKASKSRFSSFDDDWDRADREFATPRRRADAHPDAPMRRPIMAGTEMGTPMDQVTAPSHAHDEEPDAYDTLDLAEFGECLDRDLPMPEPVMAKQDVHEALEAEVEAEFDVTPELAEPVFEVPLPRRDSTPELTQDHVAEDHDEPTAPQRYPAETEAPKQPSTVKADLAELIARLEDGLDRKKARAQAQEPRQGQSESKTRDNVTAHPQARPASDRESALREALDALQKVTGKAS